MGPSAVFCDWNFDCFSFLPILIHLISPLDSFTENATACQAFWNLVLNCCFQRSIFGEEGDCNSLMKFLFFLKTFLLLLFIYITQIGRKVQFNELLESRQTPWYHHHIKSWNPASQLEVHRYLPPPSPACPAPEQHLPWLYCNQFFTVFPRLLTQVCIPGYCKLSLPVYKCLLNLF